MTHQKVRGHGYSYRLGETQPSLRPHIFCQGCSKAHARGQPVTVLTILPFTEIAKA